MMKAGMGLIRESVTFSCWCSWNYIGEFLQLGHKKPIHVVGMRVKSPSQFQRRMKSTFFEPKKKKNNNFRVYNQSTFSWWKNTLITLFTWWSLPCQSHVQWELIWHSFSLKRSPPPIHFPPPGRIHFDQYPRLSATSDPTQTTHNPKNECRRHETKQHFLISCISDTYHYWTCAVDQISSRRGLSIDRVNGR